MQPLLIAVCVPQDGNFDINKIRHHVDDCSCRRRHPLYAVECQTYVMQRPEATVEERAHECAEAALMFNTNAAIGVGFERGSKVFYHKKRPIITQIAAAVLIKRKDPRNPQYVVTTYAGTSDYAAQLLDLCRKQGFSEAPFGQKCVADRAVLETL